MELGRKKTGSGKDGAESPKRRKGIFYPFTVYLTLLSVAQNT
jgi:hypothetical protein